MYKIIGSNLGHKFQPIGLKGFPQRYIKIVFTMVRHAGMNENIKLWEYSNSKKKVKPRKALYTSHSKPLYDNIICWGFLPT